MRRPETVDNPNSVLPKKIPRSTSVYYWRELATQFTRQLIGPPDLEDLRDKIDLEFTAADIEGWLDRAAIMTGLDYLNAYLLVRFWGRLHGARLRNIVFRLFSSGKIRRIGRGIYIAVR